MSWLVTPPLDGVRVLDLTRLVAGNQLTMLLGDFGADVVKVEQPGSGDTLRHWQIDGAEVHWKVYGRNKRSITCDLKHPTMREVLLRLVDDADVFVESFRPGTLERLGFGPDDLFARNPRLVMVRVSGWGQTGSMAQEPGFGTLIEATSGLAAMNGFPDREPVLPPGALADMVSGTYGAFAVTMALRHAESTGAGQVIDLSLFEPLFSVLGPLAAVYERTGEVPGRCGSRSRTSAPRNVYRCKDGNYVALSGSTQVMTERLFRTIGRPELLDDPRFIDNATRLTNVEELDAIIGGYFAQHTAEENVAIMREAGVTVAPVSTIDQLAGSEFFATRGVLTDGPDVDGGGISMHAVVPRMSDTPGTVRLPAPLLGQHNEELVRDLVDDEQWEQLVADGIV